jgi:hypothetical protein
MIKIQTGQVYWIGSPETYDKKNNKQKVRFAMTQPNAVISGRLEHVEYDLLEENINLINELRIGIGDYLEVQYQDVGRVYHHPSDENPKFYQNKDVRKIRVIK